MIKYNVNGQSKYFDLRMDKYIEALQDQVVCDFYDMDAEVVEPKLDEYETKISIIIECIKNQDEEKLTTLTLDNVITFEKVAPKELIGFEVK